MKNLACILICGASFLASSCGGYQSCEVDGAVFIQTYQDSRFPSYKISISRSGEVYVASYDNHLFAGGIRQHQRRALYTKKVAPAKFDELHRLIHELAMPHFHPPGASACARYASLTVYHSPIDADPEELPGGTLFPDCPSEAEAARKLAAAFIAAAGAGEDVEEWPKKDWR